MLPEQDRAQDQAHRALELAPGSRGSRLAGVPGVSALSAAPDRSPTPLVQRRTRSHNSPWQVAHLLIFSPVKSPLGNEYPGDDFGRPAPRDASVRPSFGPSRLATLDSPSRSCNGSAVGDPPPAGSSAGQVPNGRGDPLSPREVTPEQGVVGFDPRHRPRRGHSRFSWQVCATRLRLLGERPECPPGRRAAAPAGAAMRGMATRCPGRCHTVSPSERGGPWDSGFVLVFRA